MLLTLRKEFPITAENGKVGRLFLAFPKKEKEGGDKRNDIEGKHQTARIEMTVC